LTYLKELELQKEQENEADEYLDAFVALGGDVNKEGTVSKERLISIIKAEFELTIDMEEFLRKIGGNAEEIKYHEFCLLLDAGTGGNPSRVSRVSSYLS
jgi:Ca2+-binding EF-hand superfamily protein